MIHVLVIQGDFVFIEIILFFTSYVLSIFLVLMVPQSLTLPSFTSDPSHLLSDIPHFVRLAWVAKENQYSRTGLGYGMDMRK